MNRMIRSGFSEILRMGTAMLVAVALTCCPDVVGLSADEAPDSKGKAIIRGEPVSEVTQKGVGDLYALVVGISKYKNPKINLRVSDKDASDFAAFLQTQGKAFKKSFVKLLVNEEATKDAIEKLVAEWLSEAGPKDTVVLYLSGHGAADQSGDFFFVTHDADTNNVAKTTLKMKGDQFLRNTKAERVLVITDACHAGAFSQIKTMAGSETPGLTKFMKEFGRSSGRVVLSSSKASETSQERRMLGNSVFTYFLIKGLRGEADVSRDGMVDVKELYDYVFERTTEETALKQTPVWEGKVVGKFPISCLGELEGSVGLEVWFVAQDPRCTNPDCVTPGDATTGCNDPLCGDVTITDGCTMYSGQNYQIGFRPSSRCYVYVFQHGSKGDLYQLFPSSTFLAPENKLANPLEGGKIYWIPAKDAWLHHDRQEGREKIFVVACRSRNAKLEGLYAELEAARKVGEQARIKMLADKVEQGLSAMMPNTTIRRKSQAVSPSEGPANKVRSFEELSELIQSQGLDAVNCVWFRHKNR